MNWDTSDSAKFREYDQRTGGKLRAFLKARIPLINGTTIESVALEAKYKEGCEFMLRQLDDILADRSQIDDNSSGGFTAM